MSWWTTICQSCREGQRPGGFALTDRAAAFCGFSAGDRLLDVACGDGATLRHLRQTLGCEIMGVERDPALCGGDVLRASADSLPFEAERFDGVFFECALSQTEDADAALSECARVLRTGGYLVVSDLYARDGAEHSASPMGRVESQDALSARFARCGLTEVLFEDQSGALIALWASARLSGDGEDELSALWRAVKAEGLKPGYALWIGKKQSKF